MKGDQDAASSDELSLGLSVGPTLSIPNFSLREYHAFRRREARKKQEQKYIRKVKVPAGGDIELKHSAGSVAKIFPAPISVHDLNTSTAAGYAAAAAGFPMIPMQCTSPAWQYVPCGGKLYALPCVVPYWPEATVGQVGYSERRVPGQVAAVGVPAEGKELGVENASRKGINGRSNSISSKETKSESNVTNAAVEVLKPPQQPHSIPSRPSSLENHNKNTSSIKLLSPKLELEETDSNHMRNKSVYKVASEREWVEKMPCVVAKGDGPEGKTITGFLYRFDKAEISIMCVCHGESFSPSEFLRHAGSSNTSQPLRHIVVLPSPARS